MSRPAFDSARAEHLRDTARRGRENGDTPLDGARAVVRHLGASPTPAGAEFGFWTPELDEENVPVDAVWLELFLPPPEGLDLRAPSQTVGFDVVHVPVVRDGEFTWSAVRDIPAGTRETVGALYRLAFRDTAGTVRHVVDPLACSVPFGAAAPAELYDLPALLASRRDGEYFRNLETSADDDGVPRVAAPVSLLEIHVPTATAGGTMAALTREYRTVADALADGHAAERLTPSQKALVGYEAIQLMPVEPTILFEDGEQYWQEIDGADSTAGADSNSDADSNADSDSGSNAHRDSSDRSSATSNPAGEGLRRVALRRPYSTNWGYDVITVASPAVNPVLLESGRPDEFLDLIETLHTFPTGSIKVVLDVVYGHADNQTLALLNHHFFAGANMYGQNLNYRHPIVRAILLEMQRRKSDFGVDGIRVDGAQDFKHWVRAEDRLYHDDDYLRLMNDVEQEVAGVRYRPWMIFEDGRPWPRDDWELASSYREVTRQMPRVVQWGPLTFAHNTPFLFTFWISKWWRIRELLEVGANWITGNSNHDTLRRGTQVSPDALVNTYLGATLPEIFENGYDNHATRLVDAVLPGIPMDFLNANLRGPWSFVRNTDARWAIKVVSEEARFLDWAVTPKRFNEGWAFPRLKARGFHSLEGLRRFQRALVGAVSATVYEPDALAALLNAVQPRLEGPREYTGATLRALARDWMDDVHEFCNLAHYRRRIDETPRMAAGADFGWRVRRFRHRERWLVGNVQGDDLATYQHPTEGTVLLTVHRRRHSTVAGPDGSRPAADIAPNGRFAEVVLLANLEGAPRSLVPSEQIARLTGGASSDQWELVLAVPSLNGEGTNPDKPVELANSQALLYGRRR